jgi:hypothetical protein
MEDQLRAIAKRVWPEFKTASEQDCASITFDLFGILCLLPLALAGLVWLVAVTDLGLILQEWRVLLLLSVFMLLFKRFHFYTFLEAPGAGTPRFDSTLEPIVTWSAALIFGPTAVWLSVLWDLVVYGRRSVLAVAVPERLDTLRNLLDNLAAKTLAGLIALALYRVWDGAFPLPGLTLETIVPAAGATLVHLLLQVLVAVPMFVYVGMGWSPLFNRRSGWLSVLAWGVAIVMGATALVESFAILPAGLYTENGPGVYFTLLAGTLLVSWLAHRLSMSVERSQQRSRELDKLEQLGRAILTAPPDGSTLPDLLAEYVTGMFSRSQIEVRLYPEQTLLHHPDNWPPVDARVWEWLRAKPEACTFLPRTMLPWEQQLERDTGLALVPILEVEGSDGPHSDAIGGVYLSRRQDPLDVGNLLPALQSLAAQIASALHRAEVYRIERELAVAGRIQASFLPDSLPEIPGWQLAATLEPARETAGDFYDIIPLRDGCWGLVVADVADKGTGAALYMALSRTLIRTYAVEHHTQPERALHAANRRILADASANLFVTVFYGILDPAAHTLTYCNAGHNPPYLVGALGSYQVQALGPTGGALGIIDDWTWEQRTVRIAPGDTLVLYSDGITEAQNAQMSLFGEERLHEVIEARLDSPGSKTARARRTCWRQCWKRCANMRVTQPNLTTSR